MFCLKEGHVFYFVTHNPMNTLMQKLQKKLSLFLNENNSVPPWRELNCVDTIRFGGPIFAQIREFKANCGHQNYLIELFDDDIEGESIGLIYWANLEDVISVLKESAHAIEAQETQNLLKA